MNNQTDRQFNVLFACSVVALLGSLTISTAYALSCAAERFDIAPLTLEKVVVDGQSVDDLAAWQESKAFNFKTYVRGRRDFAVKFDPKAKKQGGRQLMCLDVHAHNKNKPAEGRIETAQRRCFELLLPTK